jgi:hypothetical protein
MQDHHLPHRQLPARPDPDQLRRQAKDLLRAFRSGDPEAIAEFEAHHGRSLVAAHSRLSDAQLVLARAYGFASWPRLVHHVAALNPDGLAGFERIARDLFAAYNGVAEALARLQDSYSATTDVKSLRRIVHDRKDALVKRESRAPVGTGDSASAGSAADRAADSAADTAFTLADARLHIASSLGFESWDALAASLRQAPGNPRSALQGLSTRPPFYRIDWSSGTIEPRQPLRERDWATIIDVIREYGVTGLNAGGWLTDSALERLSRVDHVTRLDLGGTKRLSDDGLSNLARMPQLRELDLSDHPGGRITDRGLEALRHLPELRRFQMCWQGGISDEGITHLSHCDHLESVNLLGSPTGNGAIEALRGKRQLRHFTTGRLVTDSGLPMLHEFPVFRTWQDQEARYDLMTFGDAEPNQLTLDGPFTDAGLEGLTGLEGVFGINFFRHVSRLTSDGLRMLPRLPNLGVLGCQGELCNDIAMRHIASIPRLRLLMAQGTVAGDAGFRELSRSKTIEYIWGRECPNLGGPGFAALADMPSLRGLAVSCLNVDDAALATLPEFPSLDWLLPMDVTDDGFRHVGRCVRLEKLTCMYCRETGDAATEHIAGLGRLKHYYAGQTRITDRSLEILGAMTSLEEVQLSACRGITDAGLAHIAKLPRLRQVSFDAGPHATRAAVALFPAHVRVDFWT